MKKSILSFLSVLFISLLFSQTINAQTNKEETDFFQSIFGMEKKAIVAEFLNIDDTNPFWTLYDEYETERKELGQARLILLTSYVENYDVLTNDQYDEVIADMITLRKSTDKLMDRYHKKIKKASGSKIAAQFFQIEGYFLTQIRAAIFEEIPYIGEFDN
jgi:hypothetical protein